MTEFTQSTYCTQMKTIFNLLVLASLSGCASTTFYVEGKRVARMEGDMTEVTFVFEDDKITFTADTVDHSSATLAAGKVSAGNITAGGVAVATSGIKF